MSNSIARQFRHYGTSHAPKRVVVTGMGIVSCLGVGIEYVWNRILSGECGISKLESKEFEKIPCRIGGQIPEGDKPGELNIDKYVSKSERRSMARGTFYALAAADEALRQAQWLNLNEEQSCDSGVAIGVGMPGMEDIVDSGMILRTKGVSKVSPLFIPKILVNMAAGHVSLKYRLKGPNHAVSTACTSGVHAIGDAARFILNGDAKLMVCGGTESCLAPMAMTGFSRMRALATDYNNNPKEASRPFDSDRQGFVMAEGAGILVLEDYEHALQRGVPILGEVLGYGLSGDSHHISAPSENGDGAYRCMKAALRNAQLQPQDIGYINAHATSTPLGDAAESRAITRLFTNAETSDSLSIAVSSTKGAVGHLLGAAGAVEAIFTLMACKTGHLPPTINCHKPDPEFSLNYVPCKSQPWSQTQTVKRRTALTNSFGFGGTNASLCLSNVT